MREWCLGNGMHIVNLSVGTANEKHRARFEKFLRRADASTMFVASAASMLPGRLEGAIGVESDPEYDHETVQFRNGTFLASPYPRPILGVPKEINLHGIRFAIAHCTGMLTRFLESCKPADVGDLQFEKSRLPSSAHAVPESPIRFGNLSMRKRIGAAPISRYPERQFAYFQELRP